MSQKTSAPQARLHCQKNSRQRLFYAINHRTYASAAFRSLCLAPPHLVRVWRHDDQCRSRDSCGDVPFFSSGTASASCDPPSSAADEFRFLRPHECGTARGDEHGFALYGESEPAGSSGAAVHQCACGASVGFEIEGIQSRSRASVAGLQLPPHQRVDQRSHDPGRSHILRLHGSSIALDALDS